MDAKRRSWVAACLRTVPADDVNFKSSLEDATVPMLTSALRKLTATPKGNGSRITAILRELRRRERR